MAILYLGRPLSVRSLALYLQKLVLVTLPRTHCSLAGVAVAVSVFRLRPLLSPFVYVYSLVTFLGHALPSAYCLLTHGRVCVYG